MPLLRRKETNEVGRILALPVERISPNPNQPRRSFSLSELRELSASIAELGMLQPLTVRPHGENWELVAGERRLRAAQLAGLQAVPCIVVDVDEEQSSLLALVENLQRRDLDFVEEALALARLINTFHLSQDEVARRIGKSQSAVANKLRLLRLPPSVLKLLRDRDFTERHARALLRLDSPEAQQSAAEFVVQQGLTVARTEEYIDSLLISDSRPARRRTTFVLKDVRLFLNTVERGLSMMKLAGVNAQCGRQDTGDEILLTIRIPKNA